MWWTPEGERILKGAEARLFREALAAIVDAVLTDEEDAVDPLWRFGVPAFDELQPGQKLALLAEVGTALLRGNEAMPRLTAVREAAVAVVFVMMRNMVRLDIDDQWATGDWPTEDWLTWRQLVLDACRERGIADELPAAECADVEEWDLLLECLSDEILWDTDWLDAGRCLDTAPEASQTINLLLGIDNDYYVAIAPDPNPEQLEGVLAELEKIVGAGPRDSRADDQRDEG